MKPKISKWARRISIWALSIVQRVFIKKITLKVLKDLVTTLKDLLKELVKRLSDNNPKDNDQLQELLVDFGPKIVDYVRALVVHLLYKVNWRYPEMRDDVLYLFNVATQGVKLLFDENKDNIEQTKHFLELKRDSITLTSLSLITSLIKKYIKDENVQKQILDILEDYRKNNQKNIDS